MGEPALDNSIRLPSALTAVSRWERIGDDVPVMLAHPDWESGRSVPVVIWMHGRTVQKEIDPGRYLRLLRSGIGVCAVDLPGHGERFDADLQEPARTLDVVLQMAGEIDAIALDLATGPFDPAHLGIGGMSAGGMATLARLCLPHHFACASVEATSGSWEHQRHREMFRHRTRAEVQRHNPMTHLDGWREIPLLALHARHDEWVDIEGQRAFLDRLRQRYHRPEIVELVEYERTGAPFEHAGFGRHAADVKERQRAFFERLLCGTCPEEAIR